MSIIYCEKHGNQWDSDKKDHGCYVCDSEETEQEQRERIEKEHGSLSPQMMEHLRAKRCHWCKRFIGPEGKATLREPNTFYCPSCYDKGLQMEYEAMGLR